MVIANELLNVSIDQINSIVSTGEPSVIEYSRIERVQNVSPSLLKLMVIGGLIGVLIAAAFIIIGVVKDDSIRSEDDVEKYLNLPILSAVPYEDKLNG
jgi:capsular polysaccharide biosynthesis protein